MTESQSRVIHVRVTSDRPFADVQAASERRPGRSSPGVYRALAEKEVARPYCLAATRATARA
jgi:hypothetical protein